MKLLLTGILTWSLSLGFSVQAAEKDHHHGHHGSEKSSAAKPEKKFAADESLKQRMNTILDTMKSLHQTEEKGMAKAQVIEAGQKVEATVLDIFKNCKLEPAADQAIHPILANILDGAKLMKKGQSEKGHKKIHQALLQYEEFFDHPGWAHHE